MGQLGWKRERLERYFLTFRQISLGGAERPSFWLGLSFSAQHAEEAQHAPASQRAASIGMLD